MNKIFEGEAKLALVKNIVENRLDNKERGMLGKPSVVITWKEIHIYYIDIENSKWNIIYNKDANTVNITLPEIEYFLPTIISETIKVDVNAATFKKEWKVLRDQLNKMGGISRKAIEATLSANSQDKTTIDKKVKDSIKSLVNKYFSNLGLSLPTVVFVK